MPSPSLTPQSSNQSPSPAKSLLSKIRSPFGSKARHIGEYYIKPDDPHKQYTPGDQVTGSVVLRVIRPLRVTHISVCLHGYVQVYKNPNAPGDGFRAYTNAIATGKDRRKAGSYFGNGFAQLFEDEVPLCGEGRLAEGTYEFKFIVVFPKQQLPSSIDFERGTVSYMLSSTITRPTAISPTIHADRKISLVENIDIAPILEPKPRVISLEPRSRKTRAKSRHRKRPAAIDTQLGDDENRGTESAHNQRISGLTEESEAPDSPAPSDVSFDSGVSSGGTHSAIEMSQISVSTYSNGIVSDAKNSTSHSIHATVSLDKAGFLRGDSINVRISVSHMKRIRSIHGVIVTLYRQARVDMHPIVPVSNEKLSDDYYPRSKTGLGGLSLSDAGSHHLFRKDLSQSFASLVINPLTLTADVKAAVRVPEEAFPTISTVPGQMISFKYYVEVILDLQGKLANLDRYFPNPGANPALPFGGAPVMGRGEDANGNISSTVYDNFVDTKELRRDKSVVTCVFEVIVGTKDTERSKRRELQRTRTQDTLSRDPQPSTAGAEETAHASEASHGWQEWSQDYEGYDYEYNEQGYGNYEWGATHTHDYLPTEHINVPTSLVEEEGLSEKERLRRAEERLLPSQPPEVDSEPSSSASHAPTAPHLPYDGPGFPSGPHARSVNHNMHFEGPSAPPADSFDTASGVGLSAPAYDPSTAPQQMPTDDKHDLQRRHLESQRSAPVIPSEDNEAGPSSPTPRPEYLPSAPVLVQYEESSSLGFGHPAESSLPRYER